MRLTNMRTDRRLAAVVFGLMALALTSADALAMYNPTSGRFLQRDPGDYVDGANAYQYARARPTVLTDRTGTQSAVPGGPGTTQPATLPPDEWQFSFTSLTDRDDIVTVPDKRLGYVVTYNQTVQWWPVGDPVAITCQICSKHLILYLRDGQFREQDTGWGIDYLPERLVPGQGELGAVITHPDRQALWEKDMGKSSNQLCMVAESRHCLLGFCIPFAMLPRNLKRTNVQLGPEQTELAEAFVNAMDPGAPSRSFNVHYVWRYGPNCRAWGPGPCCDIRESLYVEGVGYWGGAIPLP